MRAVVVGEGGVPIFADVPEPAAGAGGLLIRVDRIGLNRGDLRMAGTLRTGSRLGWDFAGTVLESPGRAAPPAGARVVGLLPRMGAWSARISATFELVATVRESVLIDDAAALPSAGLTALYLLEQAGPLVGRRVLVTGASGGVGHIACQLAAIAGADVTGLVRSEPGRALLASLGVGQVAVGDDAQAAQSFGPFDVILDSVGGDFLTGAMALLARKGVCIAFGVTGGREARIDAFRLYQQQHRLEGFGLFPAIDSGRSVREGLDRLLDLVADGRLKVEIGRTGDWSEIAEVAGALQRREYAGKAVLEVTE